jgi:hypothetical protein
LKKSHPVKETFFFLFQQGLGARSDTDAIWRRIVERNLMRPIVSAADKKKLTPAARIKKMKSVFESEVEDTEEETGEDTGDEMSLDLGWSQRGNKTQSGAETAKDSGRNSTILDEKERHSQN